MNRKELIDYLPIAYIQDYFKNTNYFKVTIHGDLIDQLELPVHLNIVQIKSYGSYFKNKIEKEISKKHYLLSYTGFTPELIESINYNIFPITLREIITRKKSLLFFFESIIPIPDDVIGSWICIKKSIIKKSDEIYFFDIKEKYVKDEKHHIIGKVIDYLETGAHGILIIELETLQKSIFVPFIDQFCQVHYDSLKKEIDYIEIKNWQFFLET